MSGKPFWKLTYANVMATIAVFLALSGGVYAAIHLERNSVRSRNIVNGQVKGADLARNAVGSPRIRDRQVKSRDLAAPERTKSAGLVQNPTFNCANAPNQWASSRPGVNGQVGYYRDLGGVVHLVGDAALCGNPPGGNLIFALPPGYRPAVEQDQAVVNNGNFDDLSIKSTGLVFDFTAVSGAIVALDGATFRCGPSGKNGCP